MKISFLMPLVCFITACTPSTITPVSNTDKKNYRGNATVLIAIEGTDSREVRHIEIITKEEPEGYEIYFHDKKRGKGFIVLELPAPSRDIRIKEYSLTGMYGCSRGKEGYGYGTKIIPQINSGNIYFLGTINTSMNTVYNEMPSSLRKEAKEKYGYHPQGEDLGESKRFNSRISP